MSKAVRHRKKMNSYLKTGVLMLIGACIGAVSAIFFLSSENIMSKLLIKVSGGISGNLFLIVLLLTVGTIVSCGISYWRAERILKQIETCDEEDEEILDCRFEIWSTVEALVSQISLFASLMLLGFLPMTEERINTLGVIIPFIVLVIFSSIFQIVMIKQTQRKDPSKKGDPSDFRFDKKWLESCDEAEKEIIFQAAYKTFNFMKYILLAGLVFALLAQFHWGAGVAPLLFIGIIYITMMTVYSVYAVKLQKSKLNN